MMTIKKLFVVAFMASGCVFLTSGQSHASIVFSNGNVDGTTNGYNISSTDGSTNSDFGTTHNWVSNSFSLSEPTTTLIGAVDVGLWTFSGDGAPTGVTWSIGSDGSTDLISDVVSATTATSFVATLLTVPMSGANNGYSIWNASFDISATLSAGTYWFTLQLANTANHSQLVFWDDNNGTNSAAYASDIGSLTDDIVTGSNSESFKLNDDTISSVPEPGSLTLLGFGLASFGGMGWFKKRKQAAL